MRRPIVLVGASGWRCCCCPGRHSVSGRPPTTAVHSSLSLLILHRRSTYGAGSGDTTTSGRRLSRASTDSTITPTSPTASVITCSTTPTAPTVTGGLPGGGLPGGGLSGGEKDTGGAETQEEEETARDQCHNITAKIPPLPPGKPEVGETAGTTGGGSGGPQGGGTERQDQVDSGGQGGGTGEGTGGVVAIERVVLRHHNTIPPCPHGLPTNRPCEQCLNSNNNPPGTAPTESRPPPPVPPKPAESYSQSQAAGAGTAGRQPPPVPPKRHSVVAESSPGVNNNTLVSGSGTGGSKPAPPVPPKPGDRNSGCGGGGGSLRRQDSSGGGKTGPPPVKPKPSPGGPANPPPQEQQQQQQQSAQQFWRNQNGMETDQPGGAGGGIISARPKSAGSSIVAVAGDSPRSSSGGGLGERGCTTPPPPPPPVPPKPKPALMSSAVDVWREAHTDTSSELDQRSAASSSQLHQKSAEDKLTTSGSGPVVRRRPQRKFHRSRSDLTKRFSNSSDLSELSARFSRNSADLERFFNEMGLDRSVLEPMMVSACQRSASDLHLFESASSLESPDIRSWGSDDENPLKHEVVEERTPQGGQTSIVERNARIIKWLCSVKKAASHEEPLTEQ